MSDNRRISRSALRIFVAVVCVALCAVLATGVAWARYRNEIVKDITLKSDDFANVVLTVENAAAETVPETTEQPLAETVPQAAVAIPVKLTNGTAENFADKDLTVQLCMFADLRFGDAQQMRVTLTVPRAMEEAQPSAEASAQAETEPEPEEITYYGIAQPVLEGSAIYRSYGYGWTYRFYKDEAGKFPVYITLLGSALRQWEGKLHIAGAEGSVSLVNVWVEEVRK